MFPWFSELRLPGVSGKIVVSSQGVLAAYPRSLHLCHEVSKSWVLTRGGLSAIQQAQFLVDADNIPKFRSNGKEGRYLDS